MRKLIVVVLFYCLTIKRSRSDSFKEKFLYSFGALAQNESFEASECKRHLKLVHDFLKSEVRSFLYDMFTSSSVIRGNIKYGNTFDYGNFDECMKINHETESGELITGQYCLYQYYSVLNNVNMGSEYSILNTGWKNLNSRLGGAVCIPSSCPPEIVERLVTNFFDGNEFAIAKDYNQSRYCKVLKQNEKTSRFSVVLFSTTAAIIIMTILGTSYDFIFRNEEEKGRNRFLMAFSFRANWCKLRQDVKQNPEMFSYIRGMRALLTIIITCGHSFFPRYYYPHHHPKDNIVGTDNFTLSLFAFVLLEGFFVIIGLLAATNIFKILDSGNFSAWKIYVYRFSRVTPTLAITVMISLAFGKYCVQHSPYAFNKDIVEPCEKFWLFTLLHIQTYTNPEEMCLPHSWFIAVDLQMIMFYPLLLYAVWKFGDKIILILPAIILVSIIGAFEAAYRRKYLIAAFLEGDESIQNFSNTFYIKTHFRGNTILIGVILGYFMDSRKKPELVIKIFKILLWSFLAVMTPVVIATFIDLENSLRSVLMTSFILAFVFTYAAICISVLIYLLHKGVFKSLNAVLSHRYWLSENLGMGFYMMNMALGLALQSSQKVPISSGSFQMMFNVVGDFAITYLSATLLYILVEAPWNQILFLLFSKKRIESHAVPSSSRYKDL